MQSTAQQSGRTSALPQHALGGLSEAHATNTAIVGTIITGPIIIALTTRSLASMSMTITGEYLRLPAFRMPSFFHYPGALGKGEDLELPEVSASDQRN